MSTLLVIAPGSDMHRDAIFNLLVAETGETLASHLCSASGYAPGDLYYNRPERIKEWAERFGEVEVKFIDETDIPEEELLRRNNAWFEALPKEEA